MKPKKTTARMCAVCKQMKDKSLLLRVVKNKDGAIFLDFSGKAAGRGAFICKSVECIERTKKQRALSRSFKCEVPDRVYEEVLDYGKQLKGI